jgi:hypothetical protein
MAHVVPLMLQRKALIFMNSWWRGRCTRGGMRSLSSFFFLVVVAAAVSAVVACGGSAESPGNGDAPGAASGTGAPSNPPECPADYPGTGPACAPQGIECTYVEAGATKRVKCITEGRDSGSPKTPSWWPSY